MGILLYISACFNECAVLDKLMYFDTVGRVLIFMAVDRKKELFMLYSRLAFLNVRFLLARIYFTSAFPVVRLSGVAASAGC